MHPIATETIARQRIAERRAQADHHRVVRAARAVPRERARTQLATVVSLWGRRRSANHGIHRAA